MGIKQRTTSLKRREDELANSFYQLNVLSGSEAVSANIPSFQSTMLKNDFSEISPSQLDIFQINIGKLCNQTCAHCHVDAGPDRKEENMSRETLEKCLEIIKIHQIPTVDITGGAPEMNPHFRWFVEECTSAGAKVIDRCNLTIIKAHKKYNDLPEFFAKNKVNVVSSLPYFRKKRTDNQRGDGVFEDSIQALKMLNEVGYGKQDTGLQLDLVYNPSGAFLPGSQEELQAEFKTQLRRKYDIEFNNLFAITNLPVSRFLDYLIETGNYQAYMTELVEAYNPQAMQGLMCRNTISVSWDGYLYDCDFNQMLDLKIASSSQHIDDFDIDAIMSRRVKVNNHCYGCTAGAGSSCGGEIV